MPVEPNPNRSITEDRSDTFDKTGAYLPAPSTEPDASGPVGQLPSIPGYAITGEIARGGMGRVLAGVEHSLDREVAIKVLLPGANADRFVTESKITAKLPHPNIPPVYSLGTLEDGSPFLAMKYIRGRTLADALKARSDFLSDLPRYLQIFEQIALAVGFAHSRGIIHRDLKPSNIMLGEFGEVQVMDWGLAKLVASDLASRASHGTGLQVPDPLLGRLADNNATVAGAVMGTPSYMAPEQARGESVDCRADVFALGGILTSILTGESVFSGTTVRETIQKAAAGDTALTLERLQKCGADAEVIALARTCLELDRAHRPADGRAVAELVSQYRQSVESRLRQAESDRAASEAKAREQTRRRKAIQWSGAIIAAVLLTGTAVSLWQMTRAMTAESATASQLEKTRKAEAATLAQLQKTETAEADARQKLGFAERSNDILGSVFDGLDPKANYTTAADLRDVLTSNLRKAVLQLEDGSIGDPLTVARMHDRLGLSLLGLGDAQQAIKLFENARDTRKARLGIDHPNTLGSMNNLAAGYQTDGKFDRAITLWEENLKLTKARMGDRHPDTLTVMNNLAEGYRVAGKRDRALPLFEETLKLRRATQGTSHPDTLTSMNNLALCLHETGNQKRAIPLWEETLKLRKVQLGDDHPDTLTVMNNLAEGYHVVGMLDPAQSLLEEALRLRRIKLGSGHPDTLTSMSNLGATYRALGKLEQALPLLEETRKLTKARLGADHPDTLMCMNNLASAYHAVGKLDLALPLLEEVLNRTKYNQGVDHPDTLTVMNNLASVYRATRKTDLAIPLLEETLSRRQAILGPDHPDTLGSMNNLATAYQNVRKLELAVPLLQETLRLRQTKLGPDHPDTLQSFNNLAMAYRASGKLELSLPLFLQAAQGIEKRQFQHEYAPLILPNVFDTLEQLDRFPEAESWRRKWTAVVKARSGPDSAAYAGELAALGLNLIRQKKWNESEMALRECLPIRQKMQPEAWLTFNTRSLLGEVLLEQKQFPEAEPMLLKGYEGMKAREKTIPPQAATRIPEALDRLIRFYMITNNPDEAGKWQAERAKYPPEQAPRPRNAQTK